MNSFDGIKHYVQKMVDSVSGMKVLLLDKETTGMVSMVYSRTQILEKEVFLIERIDMDNKEKMAHLKAVVFVRPVAESIKLLARELRDPHFGEYHIYFSNVVRKSYIEDLAEADEHEVVRQVHEYYADYYAVNDTLFSLHLRNTMAMEVGWDQRMFERICDGLVSLCLATKRRPDIRYAHSSETCMKIAQELELRMQHEHALFDFRRPESTPILLLLDRRDDPVTPLLNAWTYQAMVHELLGIDNNRVDMRGVPGIRADMKEVVLAPHQDTFYRANMYLNFGELGMSVKELVDEYDRKTKSNHNIQSIEDMQRFVETYPEFRKLSGSVSKHVNLMSELSRIVEIDNLMDVSELEQELACQDDRSAHLGHVKSMIHNTGVSDKSRLRLVMLYALRYERHTNDIAELIHLLGQAGVSSYDIAAVKALLRYAGEARRSGDLFQKSIFGAIQRFQRGLKGVSNVFTQHVPYLQRVLDDLTKGKLKPNVYPFAQTGDPRARPQDIIVFIHGGVTYQEAEVVARLNEQAAGFHITLGGTFVHNSESFLDGVKTLVARPADTALNAVKARNARRGR